MTRLSIYHPGRRSSTHRVSRLVRFPKLGESRPERFWPGTSLPNNEITTVHRTMVSKNTWTWGNEELCSEIDLGLEAVHIEEGGSGMLTVW